MAISRDEADRLLTTIKAAYDRLATAMYGVDSHPSLAYLRAGGYAGRTHQMREALLFDVGVMWAQFNTIGDLPQQYNMWITSLAQKAGKTDSCVRIVGHTSRTGSARANETLSRQRAEAVQRMLERDNRAVAAKLSSAGVGSREALVGLGTDDIRDALDRRVEFRVVDCV